MTAVALYLSDLSSSDRRALRILAGRPAQDVRGSWRPLGLLDRISYHVIARLAGNSLAIVKTTHDNRRAVLTAQGKAMARKLEEAFS